MGHLVALWWCESLWCREREARHMKSSREKRAAAAFCKCVAWVSCKQFEFSILFIFMYSDPKKIESKILVKLWEFTVLTFGRMTEICIYIYIYIHTYYICIIWIRWYIVSFVHSIFEPTNQKGQGEKKNDDLKSSRHWNDGLWFMYVYILHTYIHYVMMFIMMVLKFKARVLGITFNHL